MKKTTMKQNKPRRRRKLLPTEEALNHLGEIKSDVSVDEALREGERRLAAELKELRRRLPTGPYERLLVGTQPSCPAFWART